MLPSGHSIEIGRTIGEFSTKRRIPYMRAEEVSCACAMGLCAFALLHAAFTKTCFPVHNICFPVHSWQRCSYEAERRRQDPVSETAGGRDK